MTPTKSYILKVIPLDVHSRAVEKAKAHNPPLTLKWVLLDLLTKWAGKPPDVTPECHIEFCRQPVFYVDNTGLLFCGDHATVRRIERPCRLLKAFERTRLQRGQALGRY